MCRYYDDNVLSLMRILRLSGFIVTNPNHLDKIAVCHDSVRHGTPFNSISKLLMKGESVEQKESVFDKPKWVTFDASKDIMGAFLDSLEDGKDYKVEYIKHLKHDGGKYYILSNGVRAHESFFHEVNLEDLLPPEEEPVSEDVPEWMEGFEDLVYSGYELQYGDYLILNKLSTPQILFLKNTISSAFDTRIRDYVKWSFVAGFVGYKGSKSRGTKEIFFNDLFITKQ